jgi:hypothetical protein
MSALPARRTLIATSSLVAQLRASSTCPKEPVRVRRRGGAGCRDTLVVGVGGLPIQGAAQGKEVRCYILG